MPQLCRLSAVASQKACNSGDKLPLTATTTVHSKACRRSFVRIGKGLQDFAVLGGVGGLAQATQRLYCVTTSVWYIPKGQEAANFVECHVKRPAMTDKLQPL
jgi:hypothetical protein